MVRYPALPYPWSILGATQDIHNNHWYTCIWNYVEDPTQHIKSEKKNKRAFFYHVCLQTYTLISKWKSWDISQAYIQLTAKQFFKVSVPFSYTCQKCMSNNIQHFCICFKQKEKRKETVWKMFSNCPRPSQLNNDNFQHLSSNSAVFSPL